MGCIQECHPLGIHIAKRKIAPVRPELRPRKKLRRYKRGAALCGASSRTVGWNLFGLRQNGGSFLLLSRMWLNLLSGKFVNRPARIPPRTRADRHTRATTPWLAVGIKFSTSGSLGPFPHDREQGTLHYSASGSRRKSLARLIF